MQSVVSFSPDARYAAFEERVSCTGRHPVVVELATKRRAVLKAYGSQPIFRAGQLVFAGPVDQTQPSDSDCPENFEARALYSYEPATQALHKLAEFEKPVRAM